MYHLLFGIDSSIVGVLIGCLEEHYWFQSNCLFCKMGVGGPPSRCFDKGKGIKTHFVCERSSHPARSFISKLSRNAMVIFSLIILHWLQKGGKISGCARMESARLKNKINSEKGIEMVQFRKNTPVI